MNRYVIRAKSPKTGNTLYYTKKGTLATRGALAKFTSMDAAWKIADKLIRQHPSVRAYGLHAERLRDPGDSGLMKKFVAADMRRNPSGFARAVRGLTDEIDAAADKYEAFTGKPATKEIRFKKPSSPVGFALGELVGVIYRANREGDGPKTVYHHEFRKKSRPLLAASSDGTQLEILGGEYRVTEKGIEDT